MSNYYVYLSLDPYLAQWYTSEQGGVLPVKLRKGCAEAMHLELFLIKRPILAPPEEPEGKIAIEIPYFRNKPPKVYNYLPRAAMNFLIGIIRKRFDVQFFSEIHRFENLGQTQDEVLEAWMELRGIENTPTNLDTLKKKYQRMREKYNDRKRAKNHYELNNVKND